MQTIDMALAKLSKSRFRSSFYLNSDDISYINNKGWDTVRTHAEQFVKNRLSMSHIPNDGKQTPMKGHPVFKALHACACCCRGCLNKWYRVPIDVALTDVQQEKIVNLLMEWLKREFDNSYKTS